jgi:alpha-tubulin suppressor-like RCC1 family protein
VVIDSTEPRAARILKSLLLPGTAVSTVLTRFHLACLTLLAMLFSTGPAAAGNRVVAWGDIQYDLSLSWPAPADSTMAIAAGDFHSLALDTTGAVSAWGDDRFNQTNLPPGLSSASVAAIAAGNIHNLALLTDGTVAAWGPPPGQSGDYGQCTVPPGLHDVLAVSAGAVHSLALRRDGTVVAWGANFNGQCSIPPGLNRVTAVAGGMYHSLALLDDGTVVAWGDNRQGQRNVPADLTGVTAIAASGFHSLALRSDGTVVSWGTYGLAQCSVPVALSNVIAIATADYHSLALQADGTVVVWGFNTAGQLDIPDGLTNVVGISARGNHNMVLVADPAPALAAAPVLSITPLGGNVLLSWPVSNTSFILQQNSALQPDGWADVPAPAAVVNAQNQMVVPATDKMFFRLRSR